MKILTWNIRHGGGKRLPRVAAAVRAHDADVVVLTEYQPGPGAPLVEALRASGYDVESTTPAHRANGVLIAARVPIRRPPESLAGSASAGVLAHRWLEVYFPRKKFTLAGIYLPTQKDALAAAWTAIHDAASRGRRDHVLLVGDFNTGYAPFDATTSASFSAERFFCGMPMQGFVDVWRHRNRAALEYTWYSNAGNGFRIDHAFASEPMLRRVRTAQYSHAERKQAISDHSVLLLQVH
jgi:exonuclease III